MATVFSILNEFIGFTSALPAGLAFDATTTTYDDGLVVNFRADDLDALKALGARIEAANAYEIDTISYTSSAAIDDGTRKVRLVVTHKEVYTPLFFYVRCGESAVHTFPVGVQAFRDRNPDVFSERAYTLPAYVRFFLRVHPAKVADMYGWAAAQGIKVEVESNGADNTAEVA